jgi:hypothetical protein
MIDESVIAFGPQIAGERIACSTDRRAFFTSAACANAASHTNQGGSFVLHSSIGPSLTALLVAVSWAPAAADTTTRVPRHTSVPVVLTKEVRVGGMGDSQEKKVDFEAASDVIVNGFMVVKKGDGRGSLSSTKNVTKSMFGGKVSEELALDVDDVANFCGDTLHLQFERTFRGGARMSPIGVNSHDAVFEKGTVLLARTDRVEKSICAEHTTAQPQPLPSGLLPDDQTTDTGN